MVFFGTKASRIKDGQINNVTCPNCENQTSMTYSIFGKYAHIYWIPAFPVGRENIIECNSCKQTYKVKELPEHLKQKFEFEKQGAKTPLWYFSGLAIIACLISFGAWSSSQNKTNNEEYIKAPQIGDVYSIEASQNGYYSSIKVTDVTQDSVYVIINDYEIDRRTKISQIDKAENYTTQIDSYSKEEIINLYDENVIYEIDRD